MRFLVLLFELAEIAAVLICIGFLFICIYKIVKYFRHRNDRILYDDVFPEDCDEPSDPTNAPQS